MAPKATITVFLFLSLFVLNTSLQRKHYYMNNSMKWSDAQSYCKNYYDEPSTVSNEEMQMLSDTPQITEDFYWIRFRRSQTNYYNKYSCVVKRSSSKVHDADCDETKPFYCMEDMDLILVQQESTWEEGLQNYIDLAIINSEDIMEEAKINSTVADTDEVWTGLRFLAGHWFWVNGADFGYNVWSSDGEIQCPAMNQRCGVFDRTQGVCKPTDCERRLNFLCIKEKYED
uniref:Zgc:194252 n=1 Tax=Cyprinus carpio TaxID=7962 RepID=A0A8C1WFX7_CYPCA